MKNYLVLILLMFLILSCGPAMNCIEEDCSNSPMNFHIQATLNDTSSVLRLGDTLILTISIPDTIDTNYGNFEVEAINARRSWFTIDYLLADFSQKDSGGESENMIKTLQFGKGNFADKDLKTLALAFDENEKSAQLYIIPPKKGRYYIASNWQQTPFIFKEKRGDWYSSMFSIGLDVEDQHHELCLSWIPDLEQRVLMSHALRDRRRAGLFWYAFEVK